MKAPDWLITIDGKAVERRRLVRLSTTDNRGLEVDHLTVTFSDQDGLLSLPPKGVELVLSIGYEGEELVERGVFIVDNVKHGGPPDYVTISAKSARMAEKNGHNDADPTVKKRVLEGPDGVGPKLKAGKERSWDKVTLGTIVETIAGAYKLEPRVSKALADKFFQHIDQTESDAHFLTRLADELDAVATVKSGKLLFLEAGKAENAEGAQVGRITIERRDGDRHQYEASDKGRYTGCSAHWHDPAEGVRNQVDVGEDGYRRRLPRTYPSEAAAMDAANSEFKRLNRDLGTIDLDVADPDPGLFAETPATLSGWGKPEIDHDRWVITKVTITIDPSQGMDARIDAEVRN